MLKPRCFLRSLAWWLLQLSPITPFEVTSPQVPAILQEHGDGSWSIVVPHCPNCGRTHYHGYEGTFDIRGSRHGAFFHTQRSCHCWEDIPIYRDQKKYKKELQRLLKFGEYTLTGPVPKKFFYSLGKIGIVYSATFLPPTPHPLAGRKYIGGAARYPDACKSPHHVLDHRRKGHLSDARALPASEEDGNVIRPKFISLLREFGPSAFVWKIEAACRFTQDPEEVMKWVRENEARLIQDNGGVLRKPSCSRTKQTLNLLSGGYPTRSRKQKTTKRSDRYRQQFLVELRKYKQENGNVLVPSNHTAVSGYKLGIAVSNARRRRARLTNDELDALERLGFVWSPKDAKWIKFKQHIATFLRDNGNLRIPWDYRCKDGYGLGRAVNKVRNRGDYVARRPDRRRELEKLGFVWESDTDEKWDHFLHRLHKYKQEFGDLNVPWNHVCKDKYKLGRRVTKVRSRGDFLHNNEQRRQILNDIGFVWDACEENWDTFYLALKEFQSKKGHCRVPQSYVTGSGYHLGRAVLGARRGTYVRNRSERRAKLNELGFEWEGLSKRDENQWVIFYDKIKKFHDREGHCCVPYGHKEDGYRLGTVISYWSDVFYRQDNPERKEALLQLGFVPRKRKAKADKDWSLFLGSFRKFVAVHGHCSVPSKYVAETGYSLGPAVSQVRCRGHHISSAYDPSYPTRRDALNEIGFDWGGRQW